MAFESNRQSSQPMLEPVILCFSLVPPSSLDKGVQQGSELPSLWGRRNSRSVVQKIRLLTDCTFILNTVSCVLTVGLRALDDHFTSWAHAWLKLPSRFSESHLYKTYSSFEWIHLLYLTVKSLEVGKFSLWYVQSRLCTLQSSPPLQCKFCKWNGVLLLSLSCLTTGFCSLFY